MTRFAGRTRRIVGRVVQAIVCRPYRGLGGLLADVTHGLRRGLESVAPPGLFLSWRREVIVDRVPGLWQRM